MTIKSTLFTLAIISLLPNVLLAQSLNEKLDDSKSWRSETSRTQSSHYRSDVREQGGFTTQKEVVGQRELFQERRFNEEDFSGWVDLANRIDAIETFIALQNEGYIADDAEVLKPLPIKNIKVKPGKIVSIRDIKKAREGRYTAADLMNELRRARVLDADNFVPFPKDTIETLYRDVDFSFIDARIAEIKLPISQKQSARALQRDLNQLIRTKHRLNEVTQLESTTYQSRNETFLGQLGEQVLGNVATNVLFPNKQKVSTFEADYDSTISVSNFYSTLRTRLNNAPYDRGGDGWILLNGRKSVTTVEGHHLRDLDDRDISSGYFRIQHNVVSNDGSLDSGAIGLVQYGLSVDAFDLNPEDNTDTLPAYYSPYVGISSLNNWFQFDFNLGLSYRSGGFLDNALGWRYGFGLHFYPISPLSLDLEYVSQNQPNFIDERTEWQLDRTSVGATLHYRSLALTGGYRWYFTSVDELISGWYLGGRVYF
ncbi:MAG: hypothetical protein O3A01_02910 [bacterium]|nr:hypothetical protein [bacterium]